MYLICVSYKRSSLGGSLTNLGWHRQCIVRFLVYTVKKYILSLTIMFILILYFLDVIYNFLVMILIAIKHNVKYNKE